ncbi:baseplate J/gp47 family protein [Paraliomyxa miuraensis]|uniref:hypothetical protein n=1 Tax=Paraliomyxa miuraensis TaxID=376150 RepID=UPI0022548D3C|nr:hypothetical protein [Paraliomyxa miuraensis]MCX4245556.1 hypothetical protein [Paraliomyxa miuraensis]
MPTTNDRLTALRRQDDRFTGIDFVQVVDKCDQARLRVFFLTDPRTLATPFEDVGAATVDPIPVEASRVRIYSPRGEAPDVQLAPATDAPEGLRWIDDDATGRRVLEVTVAEPGTFTDYRLNIADARIDRVFNDARFSFKAGCESRFDCATPLQECTPEPLVDYPVDYLARDFVSFRNALLDFAAQRYPGWQLPREADLGMVVLEILAATGDELSYLQERLWREAGFEDATERRTLRRKARLVDHEIHDGRAATTSLELTVSSTTTVAAGSPVWVRTAGQEVITFELGLGLEDEDRGVTFAVSEHWNPGRITPYAFDDGDVCLAEGSTELWVRNDPSDPEGEVFTALDAPKWVGRRLLLRRIPIDPSESERVAIVQVERVDLEDDDGQPLEDALFGVGLARIRWRAEDALTFAIALEQLSVSGNIVPATAGERRVIEYRIGPTSEADVAAGIHSAVEREGPLYSTHDPSLLRRKDPCEEGDEESGTRPTIYLLSLLASEQEGLGFLDVDGDLRRTKPELRVEEITAGARQWTFRRSLLVDGSDDDSFTIEDGTWRRIVSYSRGGSDLVHRDYANAAGYTVRFGDGEFGRQPAPGALFRVTYRTGPGTRANVPAGSVSALQMGGVVSALQPVVVAVRNPLPVVDGMDPETNAQIKRDAPQAFVGKTYFAVRPEDYGSQAQTLDFVQSARARFRHTGSWLSAITAIDPSGSYQLSAEQRARAEALLDCRRQAGRDVIVVDPNYVAVDLEIGVCVARSAFPAHVRRAVLEALFGRSGSRPRPGFFSPDKFTFGTPLRRTALEAAVQAVTGVDAVTRIRVRKLGVTDFEDFTEPSLLVADDEVIRVENDPARPERGVVFLALEGGA